MLALLLGGCAGPFAGAPPPPAARMVVPAELRSCASPAPPPPVPQVPRSLSRIVDYAWAEAQARWQTAERLKECQARLVRLVRWVEADR